MIICNKTKSILISFIKVLYALIIILSIIFVFSGYGNKYIVNTDIELELFWPSAVLMEPISKKVIYSKNPHQKLCNASMTKMMGFL